MENDSSFCFCPFSGDGVFSVTLLRCVAAGPLETAVLVAIVATRGASMQGQLNQGGIRICSRREVSVR